MGRRQGLSQGAEGKWNSEAVPHQSPSTEKPLLPGGHPAGEGSGRAWGPLSVYEKRASGLLQQRKGDLPAGE